GAGPEGQELTDALDRAAQALGAGVRPEVARAVVLDAPRVVDAGELLGHRQLEVEVVLVVLGPDVEARPVVFDQVALQHQRLDLVLGLDELEVGDAPDQVRDAGGLRVGSGEVGAETVPQAQRLADVDHLTALVAHQVHAGGVGDRPQPLTDRLRGSHLYQSALDGSPAARPRNEVTPTNRLLGPGAMPCGFAPDPRRVSLGADTNAMPAAPGAQALCSKGRLATPQK